MDPEWTALIKRIAALERELAEIKAKLAPKTRGEKKITPAADKD